MLKRSTFKLILVTHSTVLALLSNRCQDSNLRKQWFVQPFHASFLRLIHSRYMQGCSPSITTIFRNWRNQLIASVFQLSRATQSNFIYDDPSQLTLTDRSVTVQRESSTALGQGCRLGFLGTLHMDVFRQRLEDEYDANIIITAPTVPYKGSNSEIN